MARLFDATHWRVAAQVDPTAPPAPPVDDDRIAEAVQARLGRIAEGVAGVVAEVERYLTSEEDRGSTIPEMADGVRAIYKTRALSWAARITNLSAVGSINQAAMFAGDLEITVAEWVPWYNHRRLHGEIGLVHPTRRIRDNPPRRPDRH